MAVIQSAVIESETLSIRIQTFPILSINQLPLLLFFENSSFESCDELQSDANEASTRLFFFFEGLL